MRAGAFTPFSKALSTLRGGLLLVSTLHTRHLLEDVAEFYNLQVFELWLFVVAFPVGCLICATERWSTVPALFLQACSFCRGLSLFVWSVASTSFVFRFDRFTHGKWRAARLRFAPVNRMGSSRGRVGGRRQGARNGLLVFV